MENLKITLAGDQKELTIREGAAQEPLPLKEPKIISISGDIHTLNNFLSNRVSGFSSQEVKKDRAIITVDKHQKTIVLQLDPENHYGATIGSKLEQSPELSQFGINTTTRYSRKDLFDKLRFNRLYFKDKNQHAQVLSGLSKLRIKTESEIEQERDNRGNKRSLHDVKTIDDGGMLKEFTITLPLFKGFKAESITVEICFDVLNGDVSFWLESVGLKEAMDGAIDEIFFQELSGLVDQFVIINK